MFTDHLIALVAALLLNGLLGGPRRWHARLGLRLPGQMIVALVKSIERRLNRDKRPPKDLEKRGTITATVLLAVSAALGIALAVALKRIYWGGMIEIVLTASMLSLRQDADFASELAGAVEANEGEKARQVLLGSIWRNAALLDGHGVCRAAVETVAVHFTDRVVSPAFWYLLLGLPGMMVCRMATLLADTTGYGRDAFGKAAFYANAVMQAVPSVLSTLLVVLSSVFLPFCNPKQALTAWARYISDMDYRKRQVGLFAAALSLSLGGPLSVYAGGEWIGSGAARASAKDARRAVLLLWFSAFLLLLCLLLVLLMA